MGIDESVRCARFEKKWNPIPLMGGIEIPQWGEYQVTQLTIHFFYRIIYPALPLSKSKKIHNNNLYFDEYYLII